MNTALNFIFYWISFPFKIPVLLLIRCIAWIQNPQPYDSTKIPSLERLRNFPPLPRIMSKARPPLRPDGYPVAGWPEHSASRTGECVEVGLVDKGKLIGFIDPITGALNRGPWGAGGDNVSIDMAAGLLLGYTSSYSCANEADSEELTKLMGRMGQWLKEHKEGPTKRFDGGFRMNPWLFGLNAMAPMAVYWTAGMKRRYWYLFFLWGYGWLMLLPTAFLHLKPRWTKKYFQWNPWPWNIRSLYNDTNAMRFCAVMQRQTRGLHRRYWKFISWVVWTGSKEWHLPFMDYWGLGYVREETLRYVKACNILHNPSEKNNAGESNYSHSHDPENFFPICTAPVNRFCNGESWDEERYQHREDSDPTSIGPYFEMDYSMIDLDISEMLNA